jgi:hypothetical protein
MNAILTVSFSARSIGLMPFSAIANGKATPDGLRGDYQQSTG